MKKMGKSLAGLLALLGVFAFLGCGGNGSTSAPSGLVLRIGEETITAPVEMVVGGESVTVEAWLAQPHGATITWQVDTANSTGSVTPVSHTGPNFVVTATSDGEVTVNVLASNAGGSVSESFAINITRVDAESIYIFHGDDDVTDDTVHWDMDEDGPMVGLSYVLYPEYAGGTVVWSSNNHAVATVNASGLVNAEAPGTVVITATVQGSDPPVYAETTIVFEGEVEPFVITRDGDPVDGTISQDLATGVTVQLGVARPDWAPEGAILWTSSDEDDSIARLDNTGLVRGRRAGTVVITATIEGSTPPVYATAEISFTGARPASSANVVFEWFYAEDGAPEGAFLPTVSTPPNNISHNTLPGRGSHAHAALMPVTIRTQGNTLGLIIDDATAGGIRMDTRGAQWAVLSVGTNDAVATTGSGAPDGNFDFTSGRHYRVTVFTDFENSAETGSFAMRLSNNTTGEANSPLGPNTSYSFPPARIFFWQNAAGNIAPANPAHVPGGPNSNPNNGIWDGENSAIVSRVFGNTLPDPLTPRFLDRAFVNITSAASGANVIIRGIRIEYVAPPVWNGIEVFTTIGTGADAVETIWANDATINLAQYPLPVPAGNFTLSHRILPAGSPGLVWWESSNTDFVSVARNTGALTITPDVTGYANITARLVENPAIYTTITVARIGAALEDIIISREDGGDIIDGTFYWDLSDGAEIQLEAALDPPTAIGIVTWSAVGTPTGVADVYPETGLVTIASTAVAGNSVVVTASLDSVDSSVTITFTGTFATLTNLFIQHDGEDVTVIPHDLSTDGNTIQLTTRRDPLDAMPGVYAVWSTPMGDPVGSVDPETGLVTLTGETGSLVVTATLGTFNPTATITVTGQLPAVDPNVIFEWMFANDGAPTGGTGDGNATLGRGNRNMRLSGRGSHPNAEAMPFMIGSNALNSTATVTQGGIRFDATAGINAILTLGIAIPEGNVDNWTANGAPASTAAAAPDGLFNFTRASVGVDRNVRITVYTTFLTASTGTNREFVVALSNTTTGQANSPLGGNGLGRVFRWQNTPGGANAPDNMDNGTWTTTQVGPPLVGTAMSNRVIPDLADAYDFLRRSFVSITSMNTDGAEFLITGIRIEYVD